MGSSSRPGAYIGLYALLSALGVGAAIAICIIVDVHLWTYITGYWNWSYYVVENTCYLGWVGTPNASTNLCAFNWGMAAFGGFFTLVVFFLSMCASRWSKSTPFVIMFLLATVVWGVAGGINAVNIPKAEDLAPPNDGLHDWRISVLALSWTAFGLCLLGLLASGIDTAKYKRPPPQQEFYPVQPVGMPVYGQPPPPGQYYSGAPPPGGYAPQPYPPAGGAPYQAPPPAGYPNAQY